MTSPVSEPTKRKYLSSARKAQLQSMKPQERFGRSGYTMMPHSYFTVLPRKLPPGSAAAIIAIGYILDRTVGATGNPEWVKVSASQLARMTGMTSGAFVAALEYAARHGLIDREDAGGRALKYRCFPESWELAPDWTKTAAPIEDAAAEPEADEPQAEAPRQSASSGVIASGKSTRPVVLSVTLKGIEQPVDLRVRALNETSLPLEFLTSFSASGEVLVTARSGEEKAKRRAMDCSDADAPIYKSQRLTDFQAYISLVCIKHFQKAADPALVANVSKLAGNATLDEYSTLVELRLRRRGNHTPGLLLELAKDAARAAAERGRLANAENAAVPVHDHAEFLRRMRADIGDNPAAIEDLRAVNPELAVELFGEAKGA